MNIYERIANARALREDIRDAVSDNNGMVVMGHGRLNRYRCAMCNRQVVMGHIQKIAWNVYLEAQEEDTSVEIEVCPDCAFEVCNVIFNAVQDAKRQREIDFRYRERMAAAE